MIAYIKLEDEQVNKPKMITGIRSGDYIVKVIMGTELASWFAAGPGHTLKMLLVSEVLLDLYLVRFKCD